MFKKPKKFITILSVALLFYLSCQETYQTYYATLADAKKDGAIDRGWIPEVLPATSRDITEMHDIDTNRVWLKFTADIPNMQILLRQLRILTDKEIDELFPFVHPPKWWEPKNSNARNIFTIAAYTYKSRWGDGRIEDETGYFFINEKDSIAFYYQEPRHLRNSIAKHPPYKEKRKEQAREQNE